jgi:hypothetical protein
MRADADGRNVLLRTHNMFKRDQKLVRQFAMRD